MDWQEDRTLRAVIWAQNFTILDIDASVMMFSRGEQTRRPLGAVVSRDWERIRSLTSLFIEVVMRHAQELVLLGRVTLELTQNLIVPLPPHDNLAVNVLDVHVFPAVGIRPHQTRTLVCDCPAYSSCLCRVLPERRGSDMRVQRGLLLHAVDGRGLLV